MSGPRELDALYTRDREARRLAQTVFDRPLVLEAGAGTGKTAALVARLVAWCLGAGWVRAAAELGERGSGAPSAEEVAARVLDGVVAITFTEAAAAEMAEKVARALSLVAAGGVPPGVEAGALPADEGERVVRAAALVVALDHLLVATIHAFCRRLLATVPLDAGLHPSFVVDADGSVLEEVVRETVEAAFGEALARSDGGDLLALAARGVGPAEVAGALETLAASGLPPEALSADPFAPEETARLAAGVREEAAALHALLQPRLAGAKTARNAGRIIIGLGLLVAALDEDTPPPLERLRKALAEALPDTLLDHLGRWAKGEFGKAESEALAAVGEEIGRRAAALSALARAATALDPELLGVARRALAPPLAAVVAEMRARGAETFAGLLRDARDALANNPAVRARKRAEITQLLVDEFQDTDRVQCEVLRLLALDGPVERRPGLFLIGDPKQSIYGWRNADLAAYDEFLALVRASGGEVLPLAVNFRSVPPLLEEVERAVGPLMRREAGVQPAFEKLLPAEGRPAGGADAVEYWVSWGRSGDGVPAAGTVHDALELEARAVAADIRERHESGGLAWREFGVLLRATGDLDAYLQALRDADVPYVVERDRSYYRRREVIEAAALVRAIVDPGDHLALLTVLRSALVGVPDAALIPLWGRGFPDLASRVSRPGEPVLDRLRSAVLAAAGELPDGVPGLARVEGWERALLAFLEQLAILREAFESEPAAAFVESVRTLTLFEATEAARTLGVYRIANLDRFFRTLSVALEEGSVNLGELLRVGVEEERGEEEGRPLETAEDAVRVMTIHKAKGLDFTHTYLVEAHHGERGRDDVKCAAEEAGRRFEYVLFGAATPGWARVAEHRRRVAEAELVRTLYVAMTRARERLVVAGRWPVGTPRARARSHLDLLARRAPGEGLEALAARLAADGLASARADAVRWAFPALAPVAERPAGSPPRGTALPSPQDVARQAEALAELRRAAATRMATPFSSPASEEAHARMRELLAETHETERGARRGGARGARTHDVGATPATAVGAAVHRLLETLDLSLELAPQVAAAEATLRASIAGLVSPDRLGEAEGRGAALLGRLRGGRLLARLAALAPHVVARELPVLLLPEAGGSPVGFLSGAVDLVYRDPANGRLVIADYKTDEVATGEEVATRVAAYALQGRVYRRALREALALAYEPRFELWFLSADRVEVVGA